MQRLLITALLCTGVALAHAEIYKWVDAQGHTHYSDQPQGNKNATTVHITTTKGVGGSSAGQKSLAEQEADFKKRRKDEADAATKEEQDAAKAKAKATYCDSVKAHMATLKSNVPLAQYDSTGNRKIVSSDDRASQLASDQKELDENCQ